MKRQVLFTIIAAFSFSLQAQFFQDESDRLPTSVTTSASMDIQAADLDEDGDLDVVLANEFQPNTILWNDGNGNFSEAEVGTLPARTQDSEDVAIADFNGDDILDLVFCSEDDITFNETEVHEYYLGTEAGNYIEADYVLPDSKANAVITADLNEDGWPDLLLGNDGPTIMLLNDSTGSFINASDQIPSFNLTTQDLLVADFNGDDQLDIFEANENGNQLFLNDGSGSATFINSSIAGLPNTIGIETRKAIAGDVDGDNDLDIFLVNVSFIPGRNPRNRLLLNDGSGVFSDASDQVPFDNDQSLDAIFQDLDQDNDLDLIVANFAGAPCKAYLNDGSGTFNLATNQVFGQNYFRDALGMLSADFNGDNLLDIYICDRNSPQNNFKDLLLFREPLTVSISNALLERDIRVYPVPVQDKLTIEGINRTLIDLNIYDLNGRLVYHQDHADVIGGKLELEWPNTLPSGGYLIQLGEQIFQVIKAQL